MDHDPTDTAPELLYEGAWLRMLRRGQWEYAERTHGNGMAVIVIAVTPADTVLFVEQYRVPLGARYCSTNSTVSAGVTAITITAMPLPCVRSAYSHWPRRSMRSQAPS